MRETKQHSQLPIGRTARIAFEMDAMRAECSKTARKLLSAEYLDERELEECARLDDALAYAHRILKSSVRNIMISRIKRRSRSGRKR